MTPFRLVECDTRSLPHFSQTGNSLYIPKPGSSATHITKVDSIEHTAEFHNFHFWSTQIDKFGTPYHYSRHISVKVQLGNGAIMKSQFSNIAAPLANWQKAIKSKLDIFPSPTNREFWNDLRQEGKVMYDGNNLFCFDRPELSALLYIKVMDVWYPVDLLWLRHNIELLPSEVINEYYMFDLMLDINSASLPLPVY